MGGATLLLLFTGGTPVVVPYDLLEAVVQWLRANCAASLPGGVHVGLCPPASARLGAYCEIMEVGETNSPDSAGSLDHGLLQISIFAKDRATVKRAGDAVSASIRGATLTFSTGTLLFLNPTGPRRLLAETAPGVGGANLFQDIRQLEYLIDPV